MYLSSLSIQGFKSFSFPTELRFDPGITAIVGPNGCGKSNVVDALRWVIGEQRARILRSDRMDNVIFNGTARRPAVGMAEVELTVANTRGSLPLQYAEVTLNRRLYRSGESEYRLNNVVCRLRDITDLLLDTGVGAGAYSVIELRMVEEILSDKALDRRHLFEEAAGISKYKQRRAGALRKLAATQASLDRARDLVGEVKVRVRRLKRQAASAARYRSYEAEIRAREIALAQIEYARQKEEEDLLAASERQLGMDLTGLEAQAKKDDAQREGIRVDIVAEEQANSGCREALRAHEQRLSLMESDIRDLSTRLETALRDQSRLEEDSRADLRVREELKGVRKEIAEDLVRAEPEARDAVERRSRAESARHGARKRLEKSREALARWRTQMQQSSANCVSAQRHADRIAHRIAFLEEEKKRVMAEVDVATASESEAGERINVAAAKAARANAVLDEVRIQCETAVALNSKLAEQIVDVSDQQRRQASELAARSAEATLLRDLIQSYDAFPDAVRDLSANLGIVTLSDLVSCASKHHAALAAALGVYSECVVVRTEDEARAAVQRLETANKGRALILVTDRIPKGGGKLTARPGSLRKLVRVSEEAVAPVVDYLLADVHQVATLDEARRKCESSPSGQCRFITPDGQWLDENGILYAGGSKEGAAYTHIRRQEDLRILQGECDRLRRQSEACTGRLMALRLEQQGLGVESARDGVQHAEHAALRAEQEAESLGQARRVASKQLDGMRERAARLGREQSSLAAEVTTANAAVDRATSAHAELRRELKMAEAAASDAHARLDAAQDEFSAASTAAVSAGARLERLNAEMVRATDDLEALASRATQRAREKSSLNNAVAETRRALDAMRSALADEKRQRKSLDQALGTNRTRLMELRTESDRIESRLRKLRRVLEETRAKRNGYAVHRAGITARMEELCARLAQKHGVELESEPAGTVTEEQLQAELADLERKMRGLGAVNALAVEEFERERERMEFLSGQCDDLESAERSLSRTIREINKTAAERFIATFEQIRENFQGLFHELFGGDARCDLRLVDGDDVLESPIAITAKPRGKRPISIVQLSSGEKTLTAIALLFAIYRVKPSPFCFLDEVDAPLDDENVGRFMHLIRRFADDTQFVLVTHNKRTMELADRLYGVTMQEPGVSSLVGVQFEEAMALAG